MIVDRQTELERINALIREKLKSRIDVLTAKLESLHSEEEKTLNELITLSNEWKGVKHG